MRRQSVPDLHTEVDLGLVRQSLGGPAAVTPELADRLEKLAAEIGQAAAPLASVVWIPIAQRHPDRVEIADGTRLDGLGVAGLLRRCEQLAAFAVSLGPGPEALMQRASGQGRLVDLALLDAIASETIEALAEQVQERVRDQAAHQGRAITRRSSPGYCDFGLEAQAAFERWGLFAGVGIELTATMMMLPEKSISALIGIGPPGSAGHKLAERPDCQSCPQQSECPGHTPSQ